MRIRKSEIGNKYGTLIVLSDLSDRPIGSRMLRWVKAKCKCGHVGEYRLDVLRYMKSCGCLTSELIRKAVVTHGLTDHPLHSHWNNMKNRCYNKNVESYSYCGAKGVVVCNEWRYSFRSFYNWAIKNGYKDGLTLDRFPNTNGNYEPGNCRWTDSIGQANNKTTNVFYNYNGQKKTLAEFARQYNIPYKRLHHRVLYLKWSLKKSLNS